MSEWLRLNEHIWLFWQLNTEITLAIITLIFIIKEFYYDAAKDKKRHVNKKAKRVKVIIDSEGQATIVEQPKGLDISIEHEGK